MCEINPKYRGTVRYGQASSNVNNELSWFLVIHVSLDISVKGCNHY